MKTGILNNAQFFIISIALAASITGCSPQNRLPAASAATPLTPTVEVTRMPTKTPEPTKKPTPEASPTPEMVAADPTNIDSWPEKFKNFYVNNPEDQSMDKDFQTFMDLSRRDYLKKAGIEGVENMNSDELLWQMIKQSAKEKKELMITPLEIVDIVTDPDVDKITWRNTNGVYGLWKSDHHNDQTIFLFQNFNYDVSVFGREIIVPRYGLISTTTGDFVGVLKLPGNNNDRAILVQIKSDINQERHFVIFQMYPNKPDYGKYRCFNHGNKYPDLFVNEFECDYTNFDGPKSLISGGFKQSKSADAEALLNFLTWNPYVVDIGDFGGDDPTTDNNRISAAVIIDNRTGLEVGHFVTVYTKEEPQETEE